MRFSPSCCFSRALFYVLVLIQLFSSALGADGIREFSFEIRALVYDPFTTKIYATSPTGLLQIDPASGQLLRSFPLGTNLSRLELGASHGLWIGRNGEGAVQRLSLETFATEEPIIIKTNYLVNDISASRFDPYTLAVALVNPASNSPEAFLIRNGVILPNSQPILHLALAANSILGQNNGNINDYPIDSLGINRLWRAVAAGDIGSVKISENVLYHGFGIAWPYTVSTANTRLPHLSRGTVTINDATKEILFLSVSEGLVLNRYDSSLRHTGNYTIPGLPPVDPTELTLAAWGSNRLAFHTHSNLYLVELDNVFLPSDVEILRQDVSPSAPLFAQPVTVTLTVTNHGPGPALSVVITNLFPVGTLRIEDGQPASLKVPFLAAGASVTLSTVIMPAAPGVLTSRAGVSAENDSDPLNNSREFSFPVSLENPRIIRFSFAAIDMAYDPSSGRLFYYNGTELAVLALAGPRLLRPLPLPGPARVAMNAESGFLVLGYFSADFGASVLARFDTFHLQQQPKLPVFFSGSILDVKISPTDPNLIVSSDSLGTFVVHNGNATQLDTRAGYLRFSEDGAFLYRSDAETCALNSYSIGPNGVTFQKSVANVACGDFSVAGGLLFFNSGTIFNPATGEKRSFGFIPPAFVSTANEGLIDVLNRTNGVWRVTRFGISNLQPVLTALFPELPSTVLDASPAGEHRLAVRTASDIYVLELPDVFSGLRILRREGNDTALRFNTTAGRRYRLERSTTLAADSWSALGAEILGDGNTSEISISTPGSTFAFYRLVQVD